MSSAHTFPSHRCRKLHVSLGPESGVLKAAVIDVTEKGPYPVLTLHLLQFAHVQVEQGVDALRLSVPIDVQLDVCWEATARTQ